MWQRANMSSGGGNIPFTLEPSNNRCTINSQNCYVWDDGGTVKIHYEFDITFSTSVSANSSILFGAVPCNTKTDMKSQNVVASGLFFGVSSGTTALYLGVSGAKSKNQTMSVNTDVTCTW